MAFCAQLAKFNSIPRKSDAPNPRIPCGFSNFTDKKTRRTPHAYTIYGCIIHRAQFY